MSHRRLAELLNNPRIWKFGKEPVASAQVISSGFPELDQALAGGWPLGAVTEILFDDCGAGELKLFMPALAALSSRTHASPDAGGWVLWVAPPHMPYAPALSQSGVELSRVLVVHARQPNQALWAMEQALISATCAVVMGWCALVDDRAMRRLQLAAEQSTCLSVLFRPARFMQQRSAAALRVHVQSGPDSVQLAIIKSRLGRPGTVCLEH